jgi:hypothetical protein
MKPDTTASRKDGGSNGHDQQGNFSLTKKSTVHKEEAVSTEMTTGSYDNNVNIMAENLIEMSRNFTISLPDEVYALVAHALAVESQEKEKVVPQSPPKPIKDLLLMENMADNGAELNQMSLNQEDWDVLIKASQSHKSPQDIKEFSSTPLHHGTNTQDHLIILDVETSHSHSFSPIREEEESSSHFYKNGLINRNINIDKSHSPTEVVGELSKYAQAQGRPGLVFDPFSELDASFNNAQRNHSKITLSSDSFVHGEKIMKVGTKSETGETNVGQFDPWNMKASHMNHPTHERNPKKVVKNEMLGLMDRKSMKDFIKTLTPDELQFVYRELSATKKMSKLPSGSNHSHPNINRNAVSSVGKVVNSDSMHSFQDQRVSMQYNTPLSSNRIASLNKDLQEKTPPTIPRVASSATTQATVSQASQLIAETEALAASISALFPADSSSSSDTFCFKY